MTRGNDGERGQSLVEFSLAILIFLVILMGTIDLARLAYAYDGVSQAAREITRVTSVSPGSTLGASAETAAVVSTQQRLVPDLQVLSFSCVDLGGTTVTGTCHPGNWVKVTVRSRMTPVTPMLAAALGTIDLTSTSSAQIE